LEISRPVWDSQKDDKWRLKYAFKRNQPGSPAAMLENRRLLVVE
jgi:hypothetical protein